MHGLLMFVLLIVFLMIYGVGRWQWNECRRRRAIEHEAAVERDRIRKVAEAAASEAAACAAVIDRIGTPTRRRKLHAVRDERSGVPTRTME